MKELAEEQPFSKTKPKKTKQFGPISSACSVGLNVARCEE